MFFNFQPGGTVDFKEFNFPLFDVERLRTFVYLSRYVIRMIMAMVMMLMIVTPLNIMAT